MLKKTGGEINQLKLNTPKPECAAERKNQEKTTNLRSIHDTAAGFDPITLDQANCKSNDKPPRLVHKKNISSPERKPSRFKIRNHVSLFQKSHKPIKGTL
jgi:hypothetical protein